MGETEREIQIKRRRERGLLVSNLEIESGFGACKGKAKGKLQCHR